MASKAALAILVASQLAWGQEHAKHVEAGYVVPAPAWVFTEEGKLKVDNALRLQDMQIRALRTENAALRLEVLRVSAEPSLTVGKVIFLVGVGLILGAGVTFGAVSLSR